MRSASTSRPSSRRSTRSSSRSCAPGRGTRLKETPDTFSGLFWNGQQALELGLIDHLGSLDHVAREIVRAEEVVDYTPKENVAERLVKRSAHRSARARSRRWRGSGRSVEAVRDVGDALCGRRDASKRNRLRAGYLCAARLSGAQQAARLDEVDDLVEPGARLQVAHHERLAAAHPPGVGLPSPRGSRRRRARGRSC